MATYAVGDVHGCYRTLRALLHAVRFRPECDQVWLAGDLVNRGPASLDVLRWARDMGDAVKVVLGNHDIYLLSCWQGLAEPEPPLLPVLAARDADPLLEWLRTRPLLLQQDRFVMAHAGLLPCWTIPQAVGYARELHQALCDQRLRSVLTHWRGMMRSSSPQCAWHRYLTGVARHGAHLSVFTCMRMCTSHRQMDFSWKEHPASSPRGQWPWFSWRPKHWRDYTILFGHWASLGFYRADGVVCLDSACVWGDRLTALCLETGEVMSHPLIDSV